MGINTSIMSKDRYGNSRNDALSEMPDECPICHNKISPIFSQLAFFNREKQIIQIVFRCPNEKCDNLFISYYGKNSYGLHIFDLISSRPYETTNKDFDKIIKSISPNFVNIYDQSFSAEQSGKDLICGCGYRKALEFLIKDYLIKNNEAEKENIKKDSLGDCVKKRVNNQEIKSVSERAAWLGNDETHYERIFKDRDLKDLKLLIELTVRWVELEELTKEAIKDLQPNNKN